MSLRENLRRDDLTHLPLRAPLIVSREMTVRQTVQAMQLARVGCALVCREEALVGIFSERDLIKRVLAPQADPDSPIEQFMTPHPVTARRGDCIGSVIRVMFQGHYRHLPIIDETGRPVGLASVKHIVAYLVDHFPSTVYNLPPQPRQVQQTREGA